MSELYFITGSSNGLGKALAELCLAQGHSVIGLSRSCTISHTLYKHIYIDLASHQALATFSWPAGIDENQYAKYVLVNNAGTVLPVVLAGDATPTDIIGIYTRNMIAPALLSNAFINQYKLIEAEKLIINISSGAATRPVDGWSAYCSTKAGLEMYTKVLALEADIQQNGFKMASIAPGIVDTNMQVQIRDADEGAFSRLQEFKDFKEQGALVSPEMAAAKLYKSIQNLSYTNEVIFSLKA